MDKLLIIDGNSIAFRAYYALPYLSNRRGQPTGAVFGFANILFKILQMQKPSHVAVAFDHSRQTFRNKIYAAYKGTRQPTPPELIAQMPVIKQMLQVLGIPTFEYDEIEADDIIGTIASLTPCDKVILSGDRDLLQLIDDHTTVILTKKGVSEIAVMDKAALADTLGIRPDQIVDFKGLMGDTSDNIPGVRGVGEKTARGLIIKHGSLENVYENVEKITGKLKEHLLEDKEKAFMSRTLATIKRDCDIDFDLDRCRLKYPFSGQAYQFFQDLEFSAITKNSISFDSFSSTKRREKIKIDRFDQLEEIVANAKEYFAYNLKDLTFAVDDEREYYLNLNYDMFGSAITFDEVIEAFKPLFEGEIVKLTLNSKSDYRILWDKNISLNNCFDLTIATYVTTAGMKARELKLSVCDYFKEYTSLLTVMKDQGTFYVFDKIEMPLAPILAKMEKNGFKINEKKLDELNSQFTEKLQAISKEIYIDAGEEFNINSPKQVAHILFDVLGINAYNNRKGSTRVTVLDQLRFIPIVDNILRYRKVSKILNTYIEVYKNICLSSGDVIHTTFNQTLTSTGRLSSSEPNLQTIPTRDEEGRELRKIFISKFEGGSLISADYSQIELRLLAHMSGEEELIKAYERGDDIHALTASQIFGVPLDKVTPIQRHEAKAVNFGIIYGISDFGLSQNIKTTRSRAKEYIENYFNRYPHVKEFMDSNVLYAKKHGQISTMFGRIRKIPEMGSSKYHERNFAERVAMNMPLQGSASDIIKLAMINVAAALEKNNMKSQLILQIHDELILDVYPGEEERAKKILKQEMENVAKLSVPLLVSVGVGQNLYDCK